MLASLSTLWHQTRNACAERYVALVLVLFSAVLMSANIADPDLWGHIQYGWDAMETGIPATTTYSYIAIHEPWINHELIAEWSLAAICGLGGGMALMVFKSCLGAFVIGSLIWNARRQGAGWGVTSLVVLAVAACLGNHWLCRPHLFSYVAFTMLLLVLDETSRVSVVTRMSWLLPPLMAIWTNAHGGFLAGLAVLTVYVLVRLAEVRRSSGSIDRSQWWRAWWLLGACYLATLVNPYGWQFHWWLYHDLSVPRPEITEWLPPDLWDHWAFTLLVAVWFVALVVVRRLPRLTTTIVLPFILWQSLSHARHTAFFAIATGLWLPPYLADAVRVCRDRWPSLAGVIRSHAAVRLAVASIVTLAGSYSVWALSYQLRGVWVERASYPVSAVRFLAEHQLEGRMVCAFNWAQYLLAARGERDASRPCGATHGILVQVDGRCRTAYSQRQLDQHFDFLLGEPDPSRRYRDPASGPYDPSAVLRAGQPDLVLTSRELRPSVRVMEQHLDEWCLLYQDGLAQLWGRRTVFDDPQSASYLPPQRRRITDEPQAGYSRWPAIP